MTKDKEQKKQNQKQGPRGHAGHVAAEAALTLRLARSDRKRKRGEVEEEETLEEKNSAGAPPAKKRCITECRITSLTNEDHHRTKPNVRKRCVVRRTRVVKRPERWEGERNLRRMQGRFAALQVGEPVDYELDEGEVEGAGYSDEESGVETEEEYEEEGEVEMDDEDEDEDMDEDEDEDNGAGAVAQEIMV